MGIEHKSLPVEFKADGEEGTFTALVSVFNNVDSVGDRMKPGAFKRTLEEWRKSGDPIPVVFNHDWGTPDAHIGIADPRAVYESDDGLVVQGKLDIGDNPVARQVYKLLKRRSLKEFSFGYTVPAGGEKRGKDGINDVLDVDLIEVGPTLKGANPDTQLQAVKSAVEGKQLSSDIHSQLRDAGRERWGDDDTWVWADDFDVDASWAVFAIESEGEPARYVKVDYTRDGDTIALAESEDEVQRSVEYRPKSSSTTATKPRLIEDGEDEEPGGAKSHSQDPLKQQSLATALEVLSDGASLHKYEEAHEPEPPEPPSEDSLRRAYCDLLLN